jgi:hypothetical protein
VKRAALTSDRELGGVSRSGLSCGNVCTLSLLIKSSSSPVTGSFIGRRILTAVFVRSRATRRKNLWRFEVLAAAFWDVTLYAVSIGKCVLKDLQGQAVQEK